MSEEASKSIPSGTPPSAGLDERLKGEVEATATAEGSKVRLSIHGGTRDERFDLDLEASGDGEMKCNLACAISKRHVDDARVRIEPERVLGVADQLRAVTKRADAVRQGGFPPCSLIGKLDVEMQGDSTTIFFMADPEQARTAGYEPPGEVMRAAEMLYEAAEKGLGMDRVRP